MNVVQGLIGYVGVDQVLDQSIVLLNVLVKSDDDDDVSTAVEPGFELIRYVCKDFQLNAESSTSRIETLQEWEKLIATDTGGK